MIIRYVCLTFLAWSTHSHEYSHISVTESNPINASNFSLAGCRIDDFSDDTRFDEMCKLLLENYEKYHVIIHKNGHHNHASYMVVALYRLGASIERMDSAFERSVRKLDPAIPSQHMVNENNWKDFFGQEKYYQDYVDFFRVKIVKSGVANVMQQYYPPLAAAVSSSLLHAIIQLGYSFESNDDHLVAEGLAWLCYQYEVLPNMNPKPSESDLFSIFAKIQSDTRLPNFGRDTGFFDRMDVLVQPETARILSEYDVNMNGLGTNIDYIFTRALMSLLASKQYDDFYYVHLCTGNRAVGQIIPYLSEKELELEVWRNMWKTSVYIYIAQGRPLVSYPKIEPDLPDWSNLIKRTIPLNDEHAVKMVFICYEYSIQYPNDQIFQQVASKVIDIFESGGDWNRGL